MNDQGTTPNISTNWKDPFQLIREIIVEQDSKIYFIPNPGNVGDALIASSAYQLFDKNDIKINIFDENVTLTKKNILVYGGGGNLVPNYNHARNIIDTYHDKVRALIVLPHTINGHSDLLNKLGPNVYLFCREDISYSYTLQHAINAKIFRYNDLAIQFDINYIKTNWYNACKVCKNYRKGFYSLYFDALRARKISTNLYCFRTDGEAKGVSPNSDINLDISTYFGIGYMADKNTTHILSKYVLYIINKFDKIYTNRLHICIAGYLLNKEVYFYPNSYYKNEAVFDSSLKSLSSKIVWVDD